MDATLASVRWSLRYGLIVSLLILAFFAGRLSPTLLRPPLIPLQDAAVAGVVRGSSTVTFVDALGGYLDIRPRGGFDTLFIFYPGGFVRPQAYVWLGVALAPLGVRTVIPVFPFDLAVVARDRAARLLPLAEGKPVVVGGHSLGGAMAARFALANSDALGGLVLLGAYSARSDDLSALPLPTLVLAAQNDGLATLEDIRQGAARLPTETETRVIRGAVHGFFGRYGPQRGDGLPTVSREEAERQIVRALRRFWAGL